MRVKTPHQTRIHVSLSLNTIESLFDLVKYSVFSVSSLHSHWAAGNPKKQGVVEAAAVPGE